MNTYENGTHYNSYRVYETRLHQPYNYKENGLLRLLVSDIISRSTNPILLTCYNFVERSMVMCMEYVDKLQHFFNYNRSNR